MLTARTAALDLCSSKMQRRKRRPFHRSTKPLLLAALCTCVQSRSGVRLVHQTETTRLQEVTRVGHATILRKASAPVALRANGPTLLRPQEAALERQVTVNAHDAPTGRRSARTPRPTRLQRASCQAFRRTFAASTSSALATAVPLVVGSMYFGSRQHLRLPQGSERRAMRPARREEMTAANAHAATRQRALLVALLHSVLRACCPARLVWVERAVGSRHARRQWRYGAG